MVQQVAGLSLNRLKFDPRSIHLRTSVREIGGRSSCYSTLAFPHQHLFTNAQYSLSSYYSSYKGMWAQRGNHYTNQCPFRYRSALDGTIFSQFFPQSSTVPPDSLRHKSITLINNPFVGMLVTVTSKLLDTASSHDIRCESSVVVTLSGVCCPKRTFLTLLQ